MLKSVYINSISRDFGTTPEDFTITITPENERFSYPPKSVRLVSANIPYSWENITSDNNSFDLIEDANPPITIFIAEGNYSGTALATVLQTSLNSAGAIYTYTVTFNTTTLLFTITASAGTFVLDFNVANSIANQLGFPSNSQSAPGISTTSTQIASVSADTEIFICSDLVGGIDNGVANLTTGPPLSDQILAVVGITGNYGSIIQFNGSNNPFYNVKQSDFGKLQLNRENRIMRFFLKFPSQLPLSLKGLNWSMVLEFNF